MGGMMHLLTTLRDILDEVALVNEEFRSMVMGFTF
jgi:hypothetical protein